MVRGLWFLLSGLLGLGGLSLGVCLVVVLLYTEVVVGVGGRGGFGSGILI